MNVSKYLLRTFQVRYTAREFNNPGSTLQVLADRKELQVRKWIILMRCDQQQVMGAAKMS